MNFSDKKDEKSKKKTVDQIEEGYLLSPLVLSEELGEQLLLNIGSSTVTSEVKSVKIFTRLDCGLHLHSFRVWFASSLVSSVVYIFTRFECGSGFN